jgi:phthalate 4,5-cis-dihydrodiol dehydrogenase
MAQETAPNVLRLGIAGLGRAFALMLPTFQGDPRIRVVAGADPREEARHRFTLDFQSKAHETVEALCDDPEVDAIYVATPHQFHAQNVRAAAAAGKHILVEKPIALTLDDCRVMIEAVRSADVQLVVGHSHSFDAPYRRAQEIIAGGELGTLGMITALNFTDFLYRPRRPEELVTGKGGGAVFNQGAHQIDIIRMLGGGRVQSVRASTGAWDPGRPTEGAYAAHLTFGDGTFATAVYSGYAHFDSDEFCGWFGELGSPKDRRRHGATRRTLGESGSGGEAALKAARNYGGSVYTPTTSDPDRRHQHFGFLLASCEHGDLRPLPDGVMIYGDDEERLERVAVSPVPRAEVIDELYEAVVDGRPPMHSGEWAMATLEVCLAILTSAAEQREVRLQHQVGLTP